MASIDDIRRFIGGEGEPGDLGPILKSIGEMAVSRSQKAFEDQSFNNADWPPRYPNQGEPKINVAGMLQDLKRGVEINERRFDDRPAGFDTGSLFQSIAWERVEDDAIEVGSSLPYASDFNFGGITDPISVTPAAKKGLAKFLKDEPEYRKQVGFLFQIDDYEPRLAPRPFIGVNQQFERDIADLVQGKIEGTL